MHSQLLWNWVGVNFEFGYIRDHGFGTRLLPEFLEELLAIPDVLERLPIGLNIALPLIRLKKNANKST